MPDAWSTMPAALTANATIGLAGISNGNGNGNVNVIYV